MGERRMQVAVSLLALVALAGCAHEKPTSTRHDRLRDLLSQPGVAPETTMATLVTLLDCDKARAIHYELEVAQAVPGQACAHDGLNLSLHVVRSPKDRGILVAAMHPNRHPPGQEGIRPVVFGRDWLVYAETRSGAKYAASRLGGTTSDLATPWSYFFPDHQ